MGNSVTSQPIEFTDGYSAHATKCNHGFCLSSLHLNNIVRGDFLLVAWVIGIFGILNSYVISYVCDLLTGRGDVT